MNIADKEQWEELKCYSERKYGRKLYAKGATEHLDLLGNFEHRFHCIMRRMQLTQNI